MSDNSMSSRQDEPRPVVTGPPIDAWAQTPEQRMPLDIYARVSGRKTDQIAGFQFWAKSRRLGPRTRHEWDALYDEFMRRPV